MENVWKGPNKAKGWVQLNDFGVLSRCVSRSARSIPTLETAGLNNCHCITSWRAEVRGILEGCVSPGSQNHRARIPTDTGQPDRIVLKIASLARQSAIKVKISREYNLASELTRTPRGHLSATPPKNGPNGQGRKATFDVALLSHGNCDEYIYRNSRDRSAQSMYSISKLGACGEKKAPCLRRPPNGPFASRDLWRRFERTFRVWH